MAKQLSYSNRTLSDIAGPGHVTGFEAVIVEFKSQLFNFSCVTNFIVTHFYGSCKKEKE